MARKWKSLRLQVNGRGTYQHNGRIIRECVVSRCKHGRAWIALNDVNGATHDEDHEHGHLEAQECEYDAVVKRHLGETCAANLSAGC